MDIENFTVLQKEAGTLIFIIICEWLGVKPSTRGVGGKSQVWGGGGEGCWFGSRWNLCKVGEGVVHSCWELFKKYIERTCPVFTKNPLLHWKLDRWLCLHIIKVIAVNWLKEIRTRHPSGGTSNPKILNYTRCQGSPKLLSHVKLLTT